MCDTCNTNSNSIIYVDYDIYLFRVASIAGILLVNKNLEQNEIDNYICLWAHERFHITTECYKQLARTGA